MRLPPLDELLVASEHGVNHLVQDVLGRFAQELSVRVQRFIVLAIESCAVLHELLAARARLDQWHGILRFRKMWTMAATVSTCCACPADCLLRYSQRVPSMARARTTSSGQTRYAAGA